MDKQRIFQIMNNPSKHDVLYDNRPVWIQEIKDNLATIGFLDGGNEKDVYIEDLYEPELYT
ncbi:MAG: H-type small acid-soluble spore protein [Oscillospiraceae bacterium]|nr:H-type small acid-soluble spore protein [Oscillospiraceae bacterium]